MSRQWRPDWKDVDQYPDPESTTMEQWAWEFLRRNDKYAEKMPAFLQLLKERAEYYKQVEVAESGEEESQLTADSERIFLEIKQFCASFGILSMGEVPLPAQNWPVNIFYSAQGISSYTLLVDAVINPAEFSEVLNSKRDLVVKLDLSLPRDRQLEAVKDCFDTFQNMYEQEELGGRRVPKSYQTRNFRNYLRALDGEHLGNTQKTIGDTIFPRHENAAGKVYEHLSAARKLAAGSYVFLVALERTQSGSKQQVKLSRKKAATKNKRLDLVVGPFPENK